MIRHRFNIKRLKIIVKISDNNLMNRNDREGFQFDNNSAFHKSRLESMILDINNSTIENSIFN